MLLSGSCQPPYAAHACMIATLYADVHRTWAMVKGCFRPALPYGR